MFRNTWIFFIYSSFFQAGNYQAAVNAYTHAIRLDCKMPAYPLCMLYIAKVWTVFWYISIDLEHKFQAGLAWCLYLYLMIVLVLDDCTCTWCLYLYLMIVLVLDACTCTWWLYLQRMQVKMTFVLLVSSSSSSSSDCLFVSRCKCKKRFRTA
jgi:hypothetical protein